MNEQFVGEMLARAVSKGVLLPAAACTILENTLTCLREGPDLATLLQQGEVGLCEGDDIDGRDALTDRPRTSPAIREFLGRLSFLGVRVILSDQKCSEVPWKPYRPRPEDPAKCLCGATASEDLCYCSC